MRWLKIEMARDWSGYTLEWLEAGLATDLDGYRLGWLESGVAEIEAASDWDG